MRRCENIHRIRGFMGKDPKIKTLRDGKIKVSFSVATKTSWKNKGSGEWQEKTEWHQCEAWDYVAERVAKWFRKGAYVVAEGPVETHKWTADDGEHEMRVIRVSDCSLCEKVEMPEQLADTDGRTKERPTDSGTDEQPAEDDDLPF